MSTVTTIIAAPAAVVRVFAAGQRGPAGPAGPQGDPGADGASAYEVAVANGFVGTESAWLASLVGPAGADGADATAAGSDTQIQFNDGGAFGGDADLTYNKTTNTLAVPTLATGTITGPDSVTGVGIAVGADADARSMSLTPGEAAPNFVSGMSVFDMLHTGNTKTIAGQSINGSGNVVLSDSDVPATVVTDATSARTIASTDAGKYIRFTATGAKTCTFDNTLTAGEYHIRNAAASGDVTLTASSTTLNAPAGGTLVLEPGMTCTVKFVGTAEFDVFGQTVAA